MFAILDDPLNAPRKTQKKWNLEFIEQVLQEYCGDPMPVFHSSPGVCISTTFALLLTDTDTDTVLIKTMSLK
jgi:hypothetical protein